MSLSYRVGGGYSKYTTLTPLWLFFYKRHLPDELRELLKTLVEPPPPYRIKSQQTLPATIDVSETTPATYYQPAHTDHWQAHIIERSTEQLAHTELAVMLGMAARGELAFTASTRQPTAATLRKIDAILPAPDYFKSAEDWGELPADAPAPRPGPVRAFAWPKILLETGFLEPEGRRYLLSDKGKRALTQPTHETLRALWTSWREQSGFDELRRVEQVKGQSTSIAKGLELKQLELRRIAIMLALSAAPAHTWIRFTDLYAHMVITEVRPSINTEYLNLYVGDRRDGQIHGFGANRVLEQSYTQCFLFEYAATLGLVDIAYTAPDLTPISLGDILSYSDADYLSLYDGLLFVRLTELGRYCLGFSEHYVGAQDLADEAHNVMLLPNYDLVATGHLAPGIALVLGLLGTPRNERTWHLNIESLLTATEAGHDLDDLEKNLASLLDKPLPSGARALFDDARRRTTMFADRGPVHLVDCADPMIALEISHHSKVGKLCTLSGSHHLLIAQKDIAAFRRTLRAAGYVMPPG